MTMDTPRALAFAVALALAGCCTRDGGEPITWNDRTVFSDRIGLERLNRIIGDPTRSCDERGTAIFALFAQHVRVGATASEMGRVLSSTNWIREANVERVGGIGGMIPVEYAFTNTVYGLRLFPFQEDRQASPWYMYISITGREPGGTLRPDDDLVRFLLGDTKLYENPTLAEFALCIPEGPERWGRRERFSRNGIHVYSLHPRLRPTAIEPWLRAWRLGHRP